MLLILDPRTSVLLLARWICHNAFALTTTLLKLPCKNSAIFPYFSALTVHICIFELASVRLLQVSKEVHSMTFKHTFGEVAFVVAAIGPLVPPGAVFLAVDELTLVHRAVGHPRLRALSMLAIVAPLALIPVSFQVFKSAHAVGLVVDPVSLIHIASWVYQATVALANTILPHALVDRAVCVVHRSHPMPNGLSARKLRGDYKLAFVLITCAINVGELVKLGL